MTNNTNGDLMLAFLHQLGGSAMVESFKQEILPLMRGEKWHEPVSPEQYHRGLRHIHRELPAYREWLMAQVELPQTN